MSTFLTTSWFHHRQILPIGSPLLFFVRKMPRTLGPQVSQQQDDSQSLSLLLSSVLFPYLSKSSVTEEVRQCCMTWESGVNTPLHANLWINNYRDHFMFSTYSFFLGNHTPWSQNQHSGALTWISKEHWQHNMQSWNYFGYLHLVNCHRNSKVTSHPGYRPMSMSAGVAGSEIQNTPLLSLLVLWKNKQQF